MHKYLIELLKENNSVIIPEIGSLMVDDGNLETVVFNSFLTFNDHALEGHIASTERMDKMDATIKVSDWIREIQSALSQGDEYSMYGLGVLLKNADGQVEFRPEVGSDSEEKAQPETPAAVEPKEEQPKEEPSKVEEPVKNTFVPDPEPTPEPQTVADKLSTESQQEEETVQEETTTDDPADPNAWKPTSTGPSRRKRTIMWSAILVVLLGGGGTAGWFFQGEIKQMLGLEETVAENSEAKKKKPATPQQETTAEAPVETNDTTMVDTTMMEEESSTDVVEEEAVEPVVEETPVEESKPEPKPAPVVSSGSGDYHVIVGSFGVEENATNFAQSLRDKGYDASVAGTAGSLNLVSAGNFSSREEAKAAISKFSGELGVSGWVWKKR